VSLPARRFQAVLRKWKPASQSARAAVDQLLAWDAALTVESTPAVLYEMWIRHLPAAVFGRDIGAQVDLETVLRTLEAQPESRALESSLSAAVDQLISALGPDRAQWKWGRLHQIHFRHPLRSPAFDRGPLARPGDGNTVNATSGAGFTQTSGASYREIIDLSNWDRSVMTNVPGESGDPKSPHYSDLIEDWAAGRYHPMLFTRKAVEAATVERIHLQPARAIQSSQAR